MRREEPIKIFAISLGVRYMGLAVLKGEELVHWAIKVVRTKGMTRRQVAAKARKLVERFIDDYRPHTLALEEPTAKRLKSSSALRMITASIKKLARRKVKKVYSFPLRKVRQHLCQGEKATRMNVERIIATRYYPWLYRRYIKDRYKDERGHWWKRKYHAPLFDAVALGIYCLEKARRKVA
jgi:Holliday junction resolvasome RuvABC endonuclease subunit